MPTPEELDSAIQALQMAVTYTNRNLTATMGSLEATKQDLMETKANYDEAMDTIWFILASLLVFFMHAGFSMLESGCVRVKNAQNILAKNLIVVCIGFLCWYVCGWAFAFGTVDAQNRFTGGSQFFMNEFMDTQGNFKQWFFQGAFCATGGTIVSGAMAERTQLKGFACFTVLMTSIIYPMVVHWGWSGSGMFSYDGKSFVGPALQDFAGSGIVHMSGGVGALIGAIVVGPRLDRWDPAKSDEFDGHSVPFCVLGTFFLWFGWYGFNPGSTLSMHNSGDAYAAAIVACNTTLAPCVAGLVVFAMRAWVVEPKCLDVGGFCNGILAGLVSITAGCGFVKHWEAIIIGLVGAFVYQGASMLLRKLKIDDVVDAVPVHGACGLWGLLAVGFFGNPKEGIGGNGVFYGGDQLGVQLVAAIFIIAWVAIWSVAIFVPLRLLGFLRMGDEIQEKGADIVEHSPGKAYAKDTKNPEVSV